jgi:hypothetical protein
MLPRLNPDPGFLVDVQQTAFSHDMLGRWVCSTWPEVSGNGGDPFDVVVIGAGMYGGYIADKIYRHGEDIGLRVLVLDAGAFLLPLTSRTCRAWACPARRSKWWPLTPKIPERRI